MPSEFSDSSTLADQDIIVLPVHSFLRNSFCHTFTAFYHYFDALNVAAIAAAANDDATNEDNTENSPL